MLESCHVLHTVDETSNKSGVYRETVPESWKHWADPLGKGLVMSLPDKTHALMDTLV